jgi:hypothetical protein
MTARRLDSETASYPPDFHNRPPDSQIASYLLTSLGIMSRAGLMQAATYENVTLEVRHDSVDAYDEISGLFLQ